MDHQLVRTLTFCLEDVALASVFHHNIKAIIFKTPLTGLSLSFEEDLPLGDLCDVTGVQDATGGEGVGGEGGALTLPWVLD